MGNYINKFFSHNNESCNNCNNEMEKEEIRNLSSMDEVTVEKDIMQTPPIIHKTLLIDPRSVTNGINRTPIEVNSIPLGLNKRISAIPRHLRTKPYLETDIDNIMSSLTPKRCLESKQDKNAEHLLTPKINSTNSNMEITDIEKERYYILGLDPRSPAADFDRTPILMPKSMERLKARSQEYLHRQGSYDTDMLCPSFLYSEMSSQFDVTEIQALPDLAACAIKSLSLNNLDYSNKSSESDSSFSTPSRTESISKTGEKVLEDQDECQKTSEQDNYGDICMKKNTEQKKKCVKDNDVIKVWRDSLVLNESQESEISESDDAEIVQKGILQVSKEEVIITLDDDSTARNTLSLKPAKFESEKTKVDTTENNIFKSDVKIITDDKKVSIPNDKNGSKATKIRTPLRNCSNNGQMQTLLTKSPQQIFKNKGITPNMLKENTPPHKKYAVKSKLSSIQWDPDSTVII